MFGTYIRRLREARNISLSQLSKETNISKSYLSSIERNIQTNPSIGILLKIVGALDVDIQELLESSNSLNLSKTGNMTGDLNIIEEINEQSASNQELLEDIKRFIEIKLEKERG